MNGIRSTNSVSDRRNSSSYKFSHNPSTPSIPPPPSASPVGSWMGQTVLFKDPSFVKYLETYDYQFCDDVSKYEKRGKIGQGTFGEVFRAEHRLTKRQVALKKVLMDNEKEGFPITALREFKILKLLNHENVVNLIEICRTEATESNRYKSTFYLVFEFCEHDLAGLLSNANVKFTLAENKMIFKQILEGLYYIHSNKILHRDLKAANILVTRTGIVKLADFGLARPFTNGQVNRYTNRVVTLWYRPPEILLGERNYGPAVDMWGAGCVMAELWTRTPIIQGNSEQHQLNLIISLCGSITPEIWPDVEALDLYSSMELKLGLKRRVRERLFSFINDNHALDLLDKLLTLDPKKRIDDGTALDHEFFYSHPMPVNLENALKQHTHSMYEYNRTRGRLSSNQRPNGFAGHPVVHKRPSHARTSAQPVDGYHERVF